MKKIKIWLVVGLITVSSFGLVAYDDDHFEISKNLEIFYTLFRELNLFYVDQTTSGEMVKTGIDAMLASLDPYTNYIPESEVEDFRFMTTGQYGGIGAAVQDQNEKIVITEIYKGSPADSAGLKPGDVILEVDGRSAKGRTAEDVGKVFKGQQNSTTLITVQRPYVQEPIARIVHRQKIQVNSVPYSGMVDDNTGYIRLSSFTSTSSQEVKDAFIRLKANPNLKGLVLDLRGNPGGLLVEAVNLVNLFVDKGKLVVSTKGKVAMWNKDFVTENTPFDNRIPIVVLVNRSSASASEIVAGAFQDLDRAVIVGEKTFGKGLVQTTRPLCYNSQLKVTTAKYYIPSGRCIQALDYAHRHKDGSVSKMADSLVQEFKTANGRKVLNWGGIVPDTKVDPEKMAEISFGLHDKNMIFNYATKYLNDHPKLADPKHFELSDAEYADFVNYVKSSDFSYDTDSEKALKKLKETAQKDSYYEGITEEMEKLGKKLADYKIKDLEKYKDQIKEFLAEEIISRQFYEDGRIVYMLKNDRMMNKAREILKDNATYTGILKTTKK